jgi:hypothetical protein
MFRDDNRNVIIKGEDNEVVLPKATGLTTLGILSLLSDEGELENEH